MCELYELFIFSLIIILSLSIIIATKNNIGKKYLACTPFINVLLSGVHCTYKLVYIKTTIPTKTIEHINRVGTLFSKIIYYLCIFIPHFMYLKNFSFLTAHITSPT